MEENKMEKFKYYRDPQTVVRAAKNVGKSTPTIKKVVANIIEK